MSETGATAEQIEAAAERAYRASFPYGGSWPDSHVAEGTRIAAAGWSRYLVPEGMVIANEADVISPELKAAMGRYANVVDAVGEMLRHGTDDFGWDRQSVEVTVTYLMLLRDACEAIAGTDIDLIRAASEQETT